MDNLFVFFTSFLAHFTALFWLLRPTDSNYVQKNIVWFIILGSKRFIQPNYELWAFGKHIWLQNMQFCVFYPHFCSFLAIFMVIDDQFNLTIVRNLLLIESFRKQKVYIAKLLILGTWKSIWFQNMKFSVFTPFVTHFWTFFGYGRSIKSIQGPKYDFECIF